MKLRLQVRHHPVEKTENKFCVLCGNNNGEGEHRGHRTSSKCMTCNVHLCTTIHDGHTTTCNQAWHSDTVVVQRKSSIVPKKSSSKKKDSEQDDSPDPANTRGGEARTVSPIPGSTGGPRSGPSHAPRQAPTSAPTAQPKSAKRKVGSETSQGEAQPVATRATSGAKRRKGTGGGPFKNDGAVPSQGTSTTENSKRRGVVRRKRTSTITPPPRQAPADDSKHQTRNAAKKQAANALMALASPRRPLGDIDTNAPKKVSAGKRGKKKAAVLHI